MTTTVTVVVPDEKVAREVQADLESYGIRHDDRRVYMGDITIEAIQILESVTSLDSPEVSRVAGIIEGFRRANYYTTLDYDLFKCALRVVPHDIVELPMYSGQRRGKFHVLNVTLARLICDSHIWFVTINGDARTCKVNGAIKTWKRDPSRVEVPIKYGMYECSRMDSHDIEQGRLLYPVTG